MFNTLISYFLSYVKHSSNWNNNNNHANYLRNKLARQFFFFFTTSSSYSLVHSVFFIRTFCVLSLCFLRLQFVYVLFDTLLLLHSSWLSNAVVSSFFFYSSMLLLLSFFLLILHFDFDFILVHCCSKCLVCFFSFDGSYTFSSSNVYVCKGNEEDMSAVFCKQKTDFLSTNEDWIYSLSINIHAFYAYLYQLAIEMKWNTRQNNKQRIPLEIINAILIQTENENWQCRMSTIWSSFKSFWLSS